MEEGIAFWIKLVGGSLAAVVTAFWAYTKFILEKGLLPPSEFNVDCAVVGQQHDHKILEILLRIKNLGSATLIVNNLRLDLKYLTEDQESPPKDDMLFRKPEDERFGTLQFPHSLTKKDLKFSGEIFVGKKGDILGGDFFNTGHNTHVQMNKRRLIWIDKEVDGRKEVEIRGGEELKIVPKNAKVRRAEDRRGRGIPILSYDTFVQPGVNQVYTFVTAVPTTATYVLVYSSFRYGFHVR